MKNRLWWFLGFYLLLSLFIIYQLVYIIIIWSNSNLFDLYYHGFKYTAPNGTFFNPPSYFEMFDFPLIGIFLSIAGFISGIISQSLILKGSTPKRKGFFLVVTFIIFLIGFYLSFAGQLFYNEWNDLTVQIIANGTTIPVPAISFYQYWVSLTVLWTIFGIFFGLVIISIILIIKLYFLNIQWARYIQRNDEEDIELELTAPLPSNGEFNPNETQTITISLDSPLDENFKNKSNKKTDSFIINSRNIKKEKIKK